MATQSVYERLISTAQPKRVRLLENLLHFRQLGFEQLEPRCMLSATPAASTTGENAAAQSINAFGLNLYSTLQSAAGGSGNLFLSPFSISTALAMAYAGAAGETAAQMASVLQFTSDPATVESGFGALLADLNSAGQSNFTLSAADALWAQQGLQLLAPFLDTMQADFGGGVNQVDFAHDPAGAIQAINAWVSQETHGKIPELVNSIPALTQLILTNAIYLNAQWARPFSSYQTTNDNFALGSGGQALVSMMHNTGYYGYMDSDGFQVLDLPYAGGRLSMDVLLPAASSGLAGLSAGQLPADLSSWLDGLSEQRVDVALPKFEMSTQFQLATVLQAMGMTDAFSSGADFSGMTDPTELQISQVIHKAFINVTEAGTEAAAATGIVMTDNAISIDSTPPIEFDADHPFLFLIRDNQTGTVLFVGQETNPTNEAGDPQAPPIPDASAGFDPTTPVKSPPMQPPGLLPIIVPVAPPAQVPAPVVTPPTSGTDPDPSSDPIDSPIASGPIVLPQGPNVVVVSKVSQTNGTQTGNTTSNQNPTTGQIVQTLAVATQSQPSAPSTTPTTGASSFMAMLGSAGQAPAASASTSTAAQPIGAGVGVAWLQLGAGFGDQDPWADPLLGPIGPASLLDVSLDLTTAANLRNAGLPATADDD